MAMPDIAPNDLEGAVAWAKAKGRISVDEVEALSLKMGERASDLGPALTEAGVKVDRMSRAEKLKKAKAVAAAAKRSR